MKNRQNKKTLRQIFIEKRNFLSAIWVSQKSKIISQKLLGMEEIKNKNNFSLYLPINNEVDTRAIIRELFRLKKTIFLPRYFENEKYQFVTFSNFESLEVGPYGILQPKNPEIFDSSQVEVAILPGVAFSIGGIRLGYGKGVFDRLLTGLDVIKIGLAFDFQIIEKLKSEPHDQIMDIIVSEKRIIFPLSV